MYISLYGNFIFIYNANRHLAGLLSTSSLTPDSFVLLLHMKTHFIIDSQVLLNCLVWKKVSTDEYESRYIILSSTREIISFCLFCQISIAVVNYKIKLSSSVILALSPTNNLQNILKTTTIIFWHLELYNSPLLKNVITVSKFNNKSILGCISATNR